MSFKLGEDDQCMLGQPNDNLLNTLKVIAEESRAIRANLQAICQALELANIYKERELR